MRRKPHRTEWYLADVVMEHRIQSDRRRVVHINSLLIEAKSQDEAYNNAFKLGRESQITYLNSVGKRVQVRFRGLRNLSMIDDKLQHGSELVYVEKILTSESTIRQLITKKKDLGIFRKQHRISKTAPNYLPKTIYDELTQMGFKDSDMFE